eukprot:COSAG02_NODE_479_length_21477_cov_49.737674_9_plen_159_part_00
MNKTKTIDGRTYNMVYAVCIHNESCRFNKDNIMFGDDDKEVVAYLKENCKDGDKVWVMRQQHRDQQVQVQLRRVRQEHSQALTPKPQSLHDDRRQTRSHLFRRNKDFNHWFQLPGTQGYKCSPRRWYTSWGKTLYPVESHRAFFVTTNIVSKQSPGTP